MDGKENGTNPNEEFIIGLLFCGLLLTGLILAIMLGRTNNDQHLAEIDKQQHSIQCYQNGVIYYDGVSKGDIVLNIYNVLGFKETKVNTLTPSLVVYKQELHCCGNQDEEATAKFYLEDGGGGEYLVVDVKQWSFDKPEEIDEFCVKMKLQLSFANKESTIG